MVAGAMSLAPNTTQPKNKPKKLSPLQDQPMVAAAAFKARHESIHRRSGSSSDDACYDHDIEFSPRCSRQQQQQQECSMCGDVGFPSELFRCQKCLHRFQHSYCSRYYPSIPSKDVCDWCSQDSHPSAGSSTAVATSISTSMKSRSTAAAAAVAAAAKPSSVVTNLGKRKIIAAADYSPSSSSPRKMKCSKSNYRNFSLISSSKIKSSGNPSAKNCSDGSLDHEMKHRDALELLLEVAQKVAAQGQGHDLQKAEIGWPIKSKQQQQHHQNIGIGKISGNSNKTRNQESVQAASPKRENFGNNSSTAAVQGSYDGVKIKSGMTRNIGASSGRKKDNKLQWTTSRSIGRRYKLLSDVLC